MRSTILALHEEQLLDNLVRLKCGLPILHIDYSLLQADMTDSTGLASGTVGYTKVDNALRFVPGAKIPDNDALVLDGSRTTNSSATATGSLVSKLSVVAKPIVGEEVVYLAYHDYLDLDTIADQRASTSAARLEGPILSPPPMGSYVLSRRYPAGWYYIPVEHRDAFRALGFAVSNMKRERPKSTKRTLRILRTHLLSSSLPGERAVLVRLDSVVPMDTGHAFVGLSRLGGRQARFDVIPALRDQILGLDEKTNPETVLFGSPVSERPESLDAPPTREVILKFATDLLPVGTAVDDVVESLQGATMDLHLDRLPTPETSSVEGLLRSLNDKLDLQILRDR